ncbi:hypothetical protein PHET_08955 [Paragonimus heterotremus]|uniref:Ubiquitin carboxyl-terminal hydrolase n=1 Tax=Paragonimus heterotremus TaxID=100268 RepID=A0A8J4SM25_9TREM|nr:hypothetical protein PHET_08955 [Paragonimus heterotremus]
MTDNCKHVLKIKTSIQLGILSPEQWHCHVCNTTESVWACLSCTNFACGRYIAEHALQHFRTTGHPLCIEVNEKFVFCYVCDDFVLNDNAPGDIKLLRMALDAVTAQNFEELSKQKRGRRILRFHIRDAKKITRRLLKADDIQTAVMRHRLSRLSWALHQWWAHYVEKKRLLDASTRVRVTSNRRRPPPTISPAFTGLRNLGNTCYMNSVLQVLRHTAPFANFIMSHPPTEILSAARKRRCSNQSFLSMDANDSATKEQHTCGATVDSNSLTAFPYQTATASLSYDTSSQVSFSSRSNSTFSTFHHVTDPLSSPSLDVLPEFKKPDLTALVDSGGGLNGGRCGQVHDKNVHSDLIQTPSAVTVSTATNHSSVYEELYNILKVLWSSQRAVVSPSNLLYTIWTALPSFKGYRQQDAQEFFSVFLDRLQCEMHGDLGTASSLTSRDFVNRTFQGHSVSHIRCSNCNLVACTEEPFSELSLALPLDCYNGEATECDLVALLQQFVSPTPIDGKSYACQECNSYSRYKFSELHSSRCEGSFPGAPNSQNPDSGSKPATPYKVDKLVSVALSRLPATSSDCASLFSNVPVPEHLAADLPQTSSLSSSSFSESACSEHSFGSPRVSHELEEKLAPLNTDPVNCCDSFISNVERSPTKCDSQQNTPYLTAATQTIRLTRLPRVLRLHIKRFRWIGRQREKVNCHVSFPLILDLSEFMLNESNRNECSRTHTYDPGNLGSSDFPLHRSDDCLTSGGCYSPIKDLHYSFPRRRLYHLTGVIVHHGRGFQSGHYTAYCLNDEPECWLNCNDANVSLCDYSEVAASQAYLLFYSELMPTSPYPNWLDQSHIASLRTNTKRSFSTAFLNPSSSSVDSTNESARKPTAAGSPSMNMRDVTVKLSPTLRRTASTPSPLLIAAATTCVGSGTFQYDPVVELTESQKLLRTSRSKSRVARLALSRTAGDRLRSVISCGDPDLIADEVSGKPI